jgi:hypothetical protein
MIMSQRGQVGEFHGKNGANRSVRQAAPAGREILWDRLLFFGHAGRLFRFQPRPFTRFALSGR